MPTVTIVAIPEEGDRVWKLSSQKVPHMTMLFLGEINNTETLSHIQSYLEHVAQGMRRFGLSVDRRGELEAPGRDTADVLFFDMENQDWLKNTWNFMLQDPMIRTAYDSVFQFDTWVPHLTLGYPDNPANDDAVDFPIGWVEFDRLAMWTEEFDGPDWVLPKDKWMGVDSAWSDQVSEFLSHHGVKGMKWGVRKNGKSRVRTSFAKPPKKLSDMELTNRVKRMETEKRYNSLNTADKSKGRQFVEEVLTNSGKRVATTVLTGGGLLVVRAALTAKFGEEVGQAVTKRLK